MANSRYKADETLLEEPPETPAHLFAVKAFKTALFGTPAPAPTVKPKKITEAPKAAASKKVDADCSLPAVSEHEKDNTSSMDYKRADVLASPAKGILLTPGTAPAKRKTVSFSEMASKHRDTIPEEAESPTRGKTAGAGQNNVRRKLFQEAEQQATQDRQAGPSSKSNGQNPDKVSNAAGTTQRTNQKEGSVPQKKPEPTNTGSEEHPDITVDLEQPRSRSGKHWMQEYQREHDSSKVEMKNLIRHNKIAKSFAEKRDQEATDFAEKLEEAEAKLKEMEQRVSGLAGQLMDERTQDHQQEDIVNELAAQTAQALRYKQKAERYRAALWGEEGRKTDGKKSAEANLRNITSLESDEISSLRSELTSLKATKKEAEQRASNLVLENAGLKEDLAKADKEMGQLRAQNRTLQQRPTQDQLAEAQQAEKRLARALEANRDLTKKIKALEEGETPRRANTYTNTDLLTSHLETAKVPTNSHLDRLSPDMSLASNSKRRRISDLAVPMYNPATMTKSKTRATPVPNVMPRRSNFPEESTADLTAEARRPRRDLRSPKADATASSRPLAHKRSALVPDEDQHANLSRPVLESRTPTGDLSWYRQGAQDNTSGRRSPIIPESARSRELRHTRSASSLTPGTRRRNASDSSLGLVSGNIRAGSRAGRTELPPDRVAAAKKRLEEKAAKRGVKGVGKENVRPAPAARGLSSYS